MGSSVMGTKKDSKQVDEYTAKRDFSRTPEPVSSRKKVTTRTHRQFVVQRHEARSLHYDLRLEADGVLKSWAVPKGPPSKAGEKRLAIRVEDHPLSYAQFEGIIPEGNYGAGMVKIRDEGWYEPEPVASNDKAILADLEKGKLDVTLHGRRLKGRYLLTRFERGGDDQWLLIKIKNKASRAKAGTQRSK
jgi:bifunctional non-homologous end joining protein LigD